VRRLISVQTWRYWSGKKITKKVPHVAVVVLWYKQKVEMWDVWA